LSELTEIKKELRNHACPKVKESIKRFMKSAPGEYAHGDRFIGVKMPVQRQLAKQFRDMELRYIPDLLSSSIHEYRSCALLILVLKYQKGKEESSKTQIVELYIKHLDFVNNWDLVDCSAHKILGPHYLDRSKAILYKWARSKNLWHRRIAIMTTFHFIREETFAPTLKISKMLLKDHEDLIHKATGWMLRELGKRDLATLESFLTENITQMPRTMLRYAIEKLPEKKRKYYLKLQ
jgi:3-methyladenine DNA glycosylase AlkD